MTRCPWCGARNYAIDMWCKRCSHYLDWAPPGQRSRRVVGFVSAVAAVVGVSLFVALPGSAWLVGSRPTVSLTVPPALVQFVGSLRQAGPPQPSPQGRARLTTTSQESGASPAKPPAQASPQAGAGSILPAPTPDTGPPPLFEAPTVPGSPPSLMSGIADPSDAVNRFYQAISAHRFDLAASLWTQQLREIDPPSVFIDQRYSSTDRIDVGSERVISSGNGSAVIYVDVIEVVGGLNRRWFGTWQVVDTAAGWLLNQPDLQLRN